jgi:hypothetical protein
VSNNFVSYFLNLLHEEGNKFLPIRTNNSNLATSSINQANPEDKTNSHKLNNNSSSDLTQLNNKFNNRFNAENIFNSPNSSGTTPKSNSTSRKISLKPLNTSRSGGGGGYAYGNNNNSPVELTNSFNSSNRSYTNNNNNYKKNLSLSAHTSPSTNVYSPKYNVSSYSNKVQSKPTLFDYLATPIKSPNYKPSDTPILISDFKSRFQQHSQQLAQMHQQQHKSSQSSLNSQNLDQDVSMAVENEPPNVNNTKIMNEIEYKKVYSDLGVSLKEKLDDLDMVKLSILAKFYSQLILSIY